MDRYSNSLIRSRSYKTFFMLNSVEHENIPANKCENTNNRWHCNIYERENSILSLSEPENAEFLDIFILSSI